MSIFASTAAKYPAKGTSSTVDAVAIEVRVVEGFADGVELFIEIFVKSYYLFAKPMQETILVYDNKWLLNGSEKIYISMKRCRKAFLCSLLNQEYQMQL